MVFLEGEFDLTSQDCFCVVSAHDMTTGAITGIELSHDEMFLLTIGADGNFFVFSIVPLDQLKEEIKANRAKLPSGQKLFLFPLSLCFAFPSLFFLARFLINIL